jgi:hypothetical protein
MDTGKAKELLFTLNTANLDSYALSHPQTHIFESTPAAFYAKLDGMERPYRTEVQFYKSMCALARGIDREATITIQRDAVSRLRCLIGNTEYRFFKTYGIEIYDMRTVYSLCEWNLVPAKDEPAVCLMRDWSLLPSA